MKTTKLVLETFVTQPEVTNNRVTFQTWKFKSTCIEKLLNEYVILMNENTVKSFLWEELIIT